MNLGDCAAMRTQLAAALPNLQRTPEVERYRAKIEQSGDAVAVKK